MLLTIFFGMAVKGRKNGDEANKPKWLNIVRYGQAVSGEPLTGLSCRTWQQKDFDGISPVIALECDDLTAL